MRWDLFSVLLFIPLGFLLIKYGKIKGFGKWFIYFVMTAAVSFFVFWLATGEI